MNKLSVYIHIPFCASKCAYCDFLSFVASGADFVNYTNALVMEIESAAAAFANYSVDTVFFGGGTPTILPPSALSRILSALRGAYNVEPDAEITVEANPETLDAEGLSALRQSGVNRLSIGVQSFNDGLLARVGRIHNAERALRAFEDARKAGFFNINLDLMFSLPGQSHADWEQTLNTAIGLAPEHLSCYGLTLEPGSRLGMEGVMIDEDADRAMYAAARSMLKNNGYEHYEISNFSLPGRRCRHNLTYWTGYEYRGFGLGAHSLVGGLRWHNLCDIDDYINHNGVSPHLDPEPLRESDLMSEFMFLGLRLIDGINCMVFSDKFDENIYRVYGDEINMLAEQGLLACEGDYIRLTERGIDLSNYVFANFI